MKIPRDVSGRHLADVLCRRWRYTEVQSGRQSHRFGDFGTISPASRKFREHDLVRLGTLLSILRVIAQHKGVTRDSIIQTL